MREIALDTETTGFEPSEGHRLVELACVELENHIPTGRYFHRYINPQRDVPYESTQVHGLTNEFLKDHPIFQDIAQEFLEFIADSPLVIHNAEFDMKFLNAELGKLGYPSFPKDRAIDTLLMARRKFPGSPASLDALCKRFDIDLSARTKHGALIDTELLAEVYLQLIGGRQPDLNLNSQKTKQVEIVQPIERSFREPRPHQPSATETAAHQEFIGKLKNSLWSQP